ncbi:hypothetical protein [Escherichia coli]|uniref:hypothetical protein n=1 Tax=Escherichia coli TaxID=562 RepID=UPI001300982E|nr:hypothetical protein [Escherichia coli]
MATKLEVKHKYAPKRYISSVEPGTVVSFIDELDNSRTVLVVKSHPSHIYMWAFDLVENVFCELPHNLVVVEMDVSIEVFGEAVVEGEE